jgi:hypothetical protein
LRSVRQESELDDLPGPQFEIADEDAPPRDASEGEGSSGGDSPPRPLKRLRRGSRVTIQEIDEEAIQQRADEMGRVLRGEITSSGASERRKSVAEPAAAKMKRPVDLPSGPPPAVEEVDEELRRALTASQLTFAEEECRRGRRLKPQPGEGSSRGAGVPPEEVAHGVGEITRDDAAISRGEEGPLIPAAGVGSGEAGSPVEGTGTAMQGEEAPAGLVATLSFLSLLYRPASNYLVVVCRYGWRATRLDTAGAPPSGASGKKEGRRGPSSVIEEACPGAEDNSGGFKRCTFRAAWCGPQRGREPGAPIISPPGIPRGRPWPRRGSPVFRGWESSWRVSFSSAARHFFNPALRVGEEMPNIRDAGH